jgi:hypothetical protein
MNKKTARVFALPARRAAFVGNWPRVSGPCIDD